jgi:hypothetical protein
MQMLFGGQFFERFRWCAEARIAALPARSSAASSQPTHAMVVADGN